MIRQKGQMAPAPHLPSLVMWIQYRTTPSPSTLLKGSYHFIRPLRNAYDLLSTLLSIFYHDHQRKKPFTTYLDLVIPVLGWWTLGTAATLMQVFKPCFILITFFSNTSSLGNMQMTFVRHLQLKEIWQTFLLSCVMVLKLAIPRRATNHHCSRKSYHPLRPSSQDSNNMTPTNAYYISLMDLVKTPIASN